MRGTAGATDFALHRHSVGIQHIALAVDLATARALGLALVFARGPTARTEGRTRALNIACGQVIQIVIGPCCLGASNIDEKRRGRILVLAMLLLPPIDIQ